jgi:preprotein translocase SecF subunit
VESGISPVLVQEAFRQRTDSEGGGDLAPLTGAKVTAADAVPGAGSVFDLALRESPTQAAQTVIQIHAALANYNHKLAKAYFGDEVTREDITASHEAEAKAALAVLQGIEKIDSSSYFHASDPIPLADRIDPFSAKQHRNNAIQAIAFSILGIIAYVAFRFRSWAFGFAAIVAIVHDVAVVLGVVAIANWLGLVDARLNLVTVAAFLTLIGYSINDTIVVFDRIRENRGAGGRTRLSDTIDKSINQTLTRTIRTTATTWVVVLFLLVMNWGAQSSLEGFAFILVIGVLVGTYSSIFIASPTVIFLPWLWEKCGGSIKSFSKKAAVYAAACAVLLLVLDFAIGGVEGDGSLAIFNNLMLGMPAGLMMLFIVNYLQWIRIDDVKETPAVA